MFGPEGQDVTMTDPADRTLHAVPDLDNLQTDLDSHHIQGYALADPDRRHFSMPLVSHIEGNLYTGGCLDGVRLSDDYSWVVSLYPWEKYRLGPNTQRVEVEMYDHDGMPDLTVLHETADLVVDRLNAGKVLVHCQAGLNRSGLVAALALIKMGRSPRQAIDLLREKRGPVVLCNRTFVRWLMTQGDD